MSSSFKSLVSQVRAGQISRRNFARMATALGVSPALIAAVSTRVVAQDATPEVDADEPLAPSAIGMEEVTRGEGGEVRIIQYQAPTSLSPHTSTGYKDYDAARLVLEPLIEYLPDAQIYPVLAAEVPSLDNGGLAEDGLSVTFTLKPDVLWSDGTPFTAEDVKFTVEWVQNPDNAATSKGSYDVVSAVEVIDDLTIKISFAEPNPFWFEPFTGYVNGPIYPKHVLEVEGAHDDFVVAPVGTGPYVVETFTPNDAIHFVTNENFRDPNKPFYATVHLKGGGDAAAAARAVLQTGEFDFAWGPQVEPDILESMLGEGTLGQLLVADGVSFERLAINHSDPNTTVNDQFSEMNTPHPILADEAVRRAMGIAINRQQIADNFYGFESPVAVNVANGDPALVSPNTEYVYDPDAAAQVLEDAGWVLDGDVRAKDGQELSLVFASPTSSRRQKTQSVIKANLEDIGFRIQLETVDSGIFFDASPGNDQSFNKFPWDLMLYISPQTGPRPLSYMEQWFAGPDGENVAQASNGWAGSNNSRWQNADYDALWEATQQEIDPDQLVQNFIDMSDLVVLNNVLVPLVLPNGGHIVANTLNIDNAAWGPFTGAYFNIANWRTAE